MLEDYLNTTDLELRIEEIREEIESRKAEGFGESHELSEEMDELLQIKTRTIEALGTEAWDDGTDLIADSAFTDYAERLAGDLGCINPDVGWPMSSIDWDDAAEQLKQDYAEIETDSGNYWGRG